MNRTEIIEKIIERFKCEPYEAPLSILKQILSEELPDFQRIDEERFKRIYASKVCDIGLHIKEYNSTLPPALVRLPKEMPALWHDAFTDLLHNRMQPSEFYSLIRKTYGTPEPKPNLPSVEELEKELINLSGTSWQEIAKRLHDKYSLKPSEEPKTWWEKAIPNETKFIKDGEVYVFKDYYVETHSRRVWISSDVSMGFLADTCTPYTAPTADEIIKKHNLTEEEVRLIREGKG